MIKNDFPFFSNNRAIYLDNAATTQKPKEVINAITEYYTSYCANTHRGNYHLGNRATIEFESSRRFIRDFIGAKSDSEVIFTKGVTEGINMVANSHVKNRYKNVIISSLEHHSNIVPWHMLGYKKGNGLRVVKFKENLKFDMEHFEELLKENPNSFVSVTHISNAFGVVHPVKEIVDLAHKYGSKVLIDGAQSLSRIKLDLKSLNADFYVISSHKTYGPTGVGVLYVNNESLKEFSYYQTGGASIDKVTFDDSIMLDSPYCFEAGTQNIAGIIGFKAALEYIGKIGYELIQNHEKNLVSYLIKNIKKIHGIELYTKSDEGIGNISFNFKDIQNSDIGLLLDKQNIAVRSGHHCAMPIMEALNINGTIRISIGVYNDTYDIDQLIIALKKSLQILRR